LQNIGCTSFLSSALKPTQERNNQRYRSTKQAAEKRGSVTLCRRLKPTRTKNEELIGTTEVVP
jgi:hypothetical protein